LVCGEAGGLEFENSSSAHGMNLIMERETGEGGGIEGMEPVIRVWA
jgi:hypothetical protein